MHPWCQSYVSYTLTNSLISWPTSELLLELIECSWVTDGLYTMRVTGGKLPTPSHWTRAKTMTCKMRPLQGGSRPFFVAVHACAEQQNALKLIIPVPHHTAKEGIFVHKDRIVLFAYCITTEMGISVHLRDANMGTSAKNVATGTQPLDVQNKDAHIQPQSKGQEEKLLICIKVLERSDKLMLIVCYIILQTFPLTNL